MINKNEENRVLFAVGTSGSNQRKICKQLKKQCLDEYELFLPKGCSPQTTSEGDLGYPVRIYYQSETCIFFRNISISIYLFAC